MKLWIQTDPPPDGRGGLIRAILWIVFLILLIILAAIAIVGDLTVGAGP